MKDIRKYLFNPVYYFIIFLGRIIPESMWWDKFYLKILYKNRMKKKLNIDNPKTYNEKLQWLKIFDHKSIYVKMVDKYEVKKYVCDIIGDKYIIPTLGVWEKFDDIDFDTLPDKFVLKCTHDSGGIVICDDKKTFDKEKARKIINHSMMRNYYKNTREWPYKNVKRRIMAEEYMEDITYGELRDYKFYVFNNKHIMTLVCSNRKKEVKFSFFNKSKEFLDIRQCDAKNDSSVQLPYNYEEMVKLAEKLSKDTIQIRVDFYEINKQIYFGELTFFDSSGFGNFNPEEWDYELGSLLKLPNLK